MIYKVYGTDENKCYSTDIKAKSPQEAAKRVIGNLIKRVTKVMVANSECVPIKCWDMKDNKLIKTL